MSARAIETSLLGVRFRSRLEARWAVMFNALGWRWEYEPVDLDGYIPDFVLLFPAGPVLVEVKPEFTVEALIATAAAKIDRSGWSSANGNDVLIVGATWRPEDRVYGGSAGALRQRPTDVDGDYYFEPSWAAGEWFTCRNCANPSLHHHEQSWFCTLCGLGEDGRSRGGGDAHLGPAPDLRAMWREAGNAVRWRGARA